MKQLWTDSERSSFAMSTAYTMGFVDWESITGHSAVQ